MRLHNRVSISFIPASAAYLSHPHPGPPLEGEGEIVHAPLPGEAAARGLLLPLQGGGWEEDGEDFDSCCLACASWCWPYAVTHRHRLTLG